MNPPAGAIHALRKALAQEVVRPSALAEAALERSNQNEGQNTYLWQNADWTLSEAARAEAMPRGSSGCFDDGRSPLWGLPISVKDCFDLAGSPTTCGVHFYRDLNGTATRDSWLVERLRATGAVIVGKTHLHPLAYGITGENPEYGDCIQPGNPGALTGGSSSGACASVLEGSAVAAIGTDTGGSVRVPAALCGLAGYRSTIGRGDWRGGAHLAESFDTMGWLFRDLQDAPLLAGPFAESSRASAT
jgi:aspartyl-tRNA(Asn)/glutamyl-tRNA(Gln) amidotransferase subunit A